MSDVEASITSETLAVDGAAYCTVVSPAASVTPDRAVGLICVVVWAGSAASVPSAASVIAMVTVSPPRGFPYWSVSVAVTTWVVLMVTFLLPGVSARFAPGPAVAVAVKSTEVIAPVGIDACSVLGLSVTSVPSVHTSQSMRPSLPVIPVASAPPPAVTSTLPPPAIAANVTVWPGTGLFHSSRTRTSGCVATAVPAVALWPSPSSSRIL